jgi:hypothetical protein
MTMKEQFELRQRQWDEFHRWESQQPPIERAPEDIIADLGAILSWLPASERLRDPDPEKTGIQKMRAALALITQHE